MAQILDQYGNPISSRELDKPQTATVSWLRRQWDEHPGRGLTPQRLKRVMDEAEQGDITAQHALFADMEELDGHIAAEMGKRILALTVLDFDITPPRNATAEEEADAALAMELIQDIPCFHQLLAGLATGIGHGFACAEITWGKEDGQWLPVNLDSQPQTWFTLAPDRKTLLLRSATSMMTQDGVTVAGEPLRPFGWIVHRHQAKAGMLARSGLHRALAWPYLFKNYAAGDLAELLEIYGIPMRMGRYDVGATPEEKADLLRAVMSIGHNAGGIFSRNMEIEFEAAATGNADPFQAMIDWCEKTESKLILGGTLTSQADGKTSTNALGLVHDEVRRDLTRSDAQQLAATLTRDLVFPLLQLNSTRTLTLRRCPRFVFDTGEAEDISVYSQALPALAGVMPIPTAWAYEKLRIPQPKDGEAVLQVQAATPANTANQGDAVPTEAATAAAASTCPHCTAAASAGNGEAGQQTPVDALAAQLQDEAAAPVLAMLHHVAVAAASAETGPQLQDMILSMYGSLPDEQLKKLMGAAMACADLAGVVDVQQGA